MSKMRDEFDAWWGAQPFNKQTAYKELAYKCWEASRAAICVDLPPVWNVEQSDYRNDVCSELDEVGVYYI